MHDELLAPIRESGCLRDFLRDLGFILIANHCRRNCLHCPAYGDTSPVQTISFHMLRQLLVEVDQAYQYFEMVPQRSIACWRISDPLDFFIRESGERRTLYDVAQLWMKYLHQGLYIVTNGSEGKRFAHEVLTQFVLSPELTSQIKLTITPCDQGWGTEHYFAHMLEDIRVLSPLWRLPSLRSERPSEARFRINLKVTPETCADTLAFVLRLLKKLGYTAHEADQLLQAFVKMVKEHAGTDLKTSLEQVHHSHIAELIQFGKGIERDLAPVQAALQFPYSNGVVEGHVHLLKLIKRQGYERASFSLLRQRVLYYVS